MIHFDIEWNDLLRIGDELGASEKQIHLALSRALKRTASKLRTLSAKGLRDELELKRLNLLRKRLKSVKLRKGGAEGVKIWYGLNDMPVSWFKGKPTQNKDGATFRNVKFPGAFAASSRYTKGKTIFKRTGKARLHIEEQLMPVKDQADVFVEDHIFVQVEKIFWPLFQREIEARVKYKIGGA
ncbi:putative minor tail protein [Ralstonia phage phiRSP]|uniref:Putative minor tail protein n=1 Tax=Ralstonia phage phiRSP TaxID=2201420 RepID=A0A345ANT1_9CAUD|nr:tail completion or Neck1 protein [Ralstonia phage phiRSP]AXF38220.1 putative minor tail protein [Ralstonia phage phiRSP]